MRRIKRSYQKGFFVAAAIFELLAISQMYDRTWLSIGLFALVSACCWVLGIFDGYDHD